MQAVTHPKGNCQKSLASPPRYTHLPNTLPTRACMALVSLKSSANIRIVSNVLLQITSRSLDVKTLNFVSCDNKRPMQKDKAIRAVVKTAPLALYAATGTMLRVKSFLIIRYRKIPVAKIERTIAGDISFYFLLISFSLSFHFLFP